MQTKLMVTILGVAVSSMFVGYKVAHAEPKLGELNDTELACSNLGAKMAECNGVVLSDGSEVSNALAANIAQWAILQCAPTLTLKQAEKYNDMSCEQLRRIGVHF